jgi:hypothetical protein
MIALAGTLQAEIIDRIAVSVGNRVITTVQINDEIRVTAFLNHSQANFSPEEKKKAAERLIEQALIKREMDFTHYPVPPLSDADEMLKQLEAERSDFARYGISEDDLRQHLWWQLTLLKFIDERFRPSVEVTTFEVRQYYREQVEKWKEEGKNPIPPFEDSRDAMTKALTEERVNQAVDRWLGDARTQMTIRMRDEVFGSAGHRSSWPPPAPSGAAKP